MQAANPAAAIEHATRAGVSYERNLVGEKRTSDFSLASFFGD